jgi:hypothetical protein
MERIIFVGTQPPPRSCQQLVNVYSSKYDFPSRRCLHFVVVGGLVWSKDPESCADGSFATGRVSHAGVVKVDDTD